MGSERSDDAGHYSDTIVVGDALGETPDRAFVGVKVGDSFRWGPLRATLKRDVPRLYGTPYTGWAEVALSDEPGSTIKAEP
jgi:hypothetical protein